MYLNEGKCLLKAWGTQLMVLGVVLAYQLVLPCQFEYNQLTNRVEIWSGKMTQ